MEPQFWFDRWEMNQIGFHQSEANPLLVAHFGAVGLAPDSRVLVPLCGKTRDIAWLLSQGHRVVGAELSEIAIRQLFEELGVAPVVTVRGSLIHFSGPGIDIHVGNIFDLTAAALGPVDAIYDRAALIALPPDMRRSYAAHLVAITQAAPQLLICFEYDQSLMAGPPFSVLPEEVTGLYSPHYSVSLVERLVDPVAIRGTPGNDAAWLLR